MIVRFESPERARGKTWPQKLRPEIKERKNWKSQ